MYLIGADVGTTATKAVLADAGGRILHTAGVSYALEKREGGHTVQKAGDWWDTFSKAVRQCLAACPDPGKVAALSLSTQGGSLVCADRSGRELCEALVWLDTRSEPQKTRMELQRGVDFFYRKTGWRLSAGLNLCKIAWIRENDPALFERTGLFLSTVDYLNMRLTGRAVIDPSNAAMTQLYDVTENRWDGQLLELCGITEARLPEILPSGAPVGTLCPRSAAELGLPEGVLVCSGGHDQYCAAAGSGALRPGDVMLSAGTAWAVLGVSGAPAFDAGFALCPGRHVAEGLWGEMATVPAAGVCMEWLCGNVLSGGESLACVDAAACARRESAAGLLFYPFFSGSGAPDYRTRARAAFLGLELSHDRYDLALAAMEGVAFQTRYILERFETCGVASGSVRVLGGAAKSGLWMRLLSDILERRLILSGGAHAACTGAVLTAGVGSGIYTDYPAGFRLFAGEDREMPGDAEGRAFYRTKYEAYLGGMRTLPGMRQ